MKTEISEVLNEIHDELDDVSTGRNGPPTQTTSANIRRAMILIAEAINAEEVARLGDAIDKEVNQ